ncbi:hypothetical protein HZC34_05940 [Candidatus Saganbacteria bacterium]|nr:hypothetical protein [Candidatus Saganbacteria bacterium]
MIHKRESQEKYESAIAFIRTMHSIFGDNWRERMVGLLKASSVESASYLSARIGY